jgi:predicted flap endonuclease-1-like 5' DNA nuclease
MNTYALIVLTMDGILFLYVMSILYAIIQSPIKTEKKKTTIEPETVLQPESAQATDPEPENTLKPTPDEAPTASTTSSYKIIEIEGIGSIYTAKLNNFGIYTTEELLEAGSTRKKRNELAVKTEISPKLILEWVNRSDLFRIKGVAEEWSDLLEEAGVDTVPELAQRVPENLIAKLVEINDEKSLVRRTPSLSMVEDWISQAKKLSRRIEY